MRGPQCVQGQGELQGRRLNDCKGKNACKGKSFVETKTAAECNQKGGTPKK